MSTSKSIDRICVIAVVAALLICILFMNGEALGIRVQATTLGYEDRLFDNSRVHTVDIVIDDWDGFLSTAQSEEYSVCDVVIDGERIANVGIRGKGNTSLSTVSSMDSDRYSFKLEFDQYDSTQSYYGLDKLSLNNLIQDNTMMKDYLTYTMMTEFGAAAPLCSYVWITVNGEDWGLYLAVEAVEDSFLRRNYGNNYGELYKPDSINMGGGRGNGMDFNFEEFLGGSDESTGAATPSMPGGMELPDMGGAMPEGFDPGQMGGFTGNAGSAGGETAPQMPNGDTQGTVPGNPGGTGSFGQQGGMNGSAGGEMPTVPENFDPSELPGNMGGGFGMGSSDVKLQYVDDDPASYSTIFSSAKTDVTEADQTRLIAALKALSSADPSAVNTEAVMRYFVVHNYVVNGDSYTGSMVHNYYLYEEDGQLSMIPWDYNLAFGTFQGNNAASAVNDGIDAPLSTGGGDRPMFEWITGSEEYTEAYHDLFREFLNTVDIQGIIEAAHALIAPYVEKDPTKFCTYAEFEKGADALAAFCDLRSQSIAGQLAGSTANVDASGLNLSDMGTMGMGGGMGRPSDMQEGQNGSFPSMSEGSSAGGEGGQTIPQQGQTADTTTPNEGSSAGGEPPASSQGGETGQFPGGTPPQQTPEAEQNPGTQMPGQASAPTGAADATAPTVNAETPFEGMQFPGGTDSMPGGNRGQFPDMGQDMSVTDQTGGQWIPLAISAAVLLLGLLFAALFKR